MNPKIVKILESMDYTVIIDEDDIRIFDDNNEFIKEIIDGYELEPYHQSYIFRLNNNQYLRYNGNGNGFIKVSDRILIVIDNWYRAFNGDNINIYYGNANEIDNYDYALCFNTNPACIFMGDPEVLVQMFQKPRHAKTSLNKTLRIIDTNDGGIIYSGKEVIGMMLNNERNPHDICKFIIRYIDGIIERMDNDKLIKDIMYSIKLVYPSLLYILDHYLEASDRIIKERGDR